MKKKSLVLLCLIFIILASLTGCSKETPTTTQAQPVTLTAAFAASLTDVGTELKTIYTSQHPNVTININFAGSGTLQKQIEQGSPADLFISAGQSQMDALAAKQLIVDASRKNLLGNELVLIAKKDSALSSFDGLTDAAVGKISIGTPESVPAGQYAKDTLTSMGLWDKLQSKLVLAKDVRGVLTYVETGNVDAGLVYRTDTVGSTVKIVAAAPAASSKPIIYPLAIITSSKQQQQAQQFADFLASDEAMQVFTKYGFTKPGQ